MQSLSPHLRHPDDHDRLPFHPGCPVCRQTRLTGSLATGALVPVRAQAAVAAGLLALSTAGPAATALAAEPDSDQDGTAPVTQTAPDPADNPDFDPGGAPSDLPDTTPPVPQAQAPSDAGGDDTGPAAQDPATNPSDAVVDTGDGSDPTTTTTSPSGGQPPTQTPTGAQQPTEPTTTPTPTPTTPEATTPASTAAPAVTPVPAEAPATSGGEVRAQGRNDEARRPIHHGPALSHHHAAAVVIPAPVAPATTTVATTAITRAAEVSAADPAKPGDRSHTVQTGESLWVIASDLLGDGASTARIAREVHRLWQLNRARIATGDPDLLLVGTRLVLK